MFSQALEIVLTVAYREATSRRHTHLTLEHLLYALAHDQDGERILAACGADLPQLRRDLDKYLKDRSSSSAAASRRSRSRRSRSGACCRRRCCTCRAPAARKCSPATCSPRRCSRTSRTRRSCSPARASPGSTCSSTSRTASARCRRAAACPQTTATRGEADAGQGERGAATSRDPLAAYAMNLTDRARGRRARSADRPHRRTAAHDGDPLPAAQEQSGVRRRRRRRQDRARRRARDPAAAATTCRICSKGAEVFSLDTGALLAGTRFRGDFEERFKAVINALGKRPMPILFIDEIHSTVGAGATTGGTMDLATLIKPILTTGQLRVVGSTTHEEFKHIEKDRALARRLQKITIDEPSIAGDGAHPAGAALALRSAPSRPLHRRRAGGGGQARGPAPARLQAARQRDRPDRRGGRARCGCKVGAAQRTAAALNAGRRQTARPSVRRSAPSTWKKSSRGWRAFPAKQASSSDKDRLKGLEESLGRVVFGQAEAVRNGRARDQALARRTRPARSAGRLLPLHRTDRRRQDRARQAARAASRQRVHPLRHERVHGEARGRPADRRAAGIRRLRAGRPARRRASASIRTRCCCSTRSRRRIRTSSTSCCRSWITRR